MSNASIWVFRLDNSLRILKQNNKKAFFMKNPAAETAGRPLFECHSRNPECFREVGNPSGKIPDKPE
jgi:hypothetical protein